MLGCVLLVIGTLFVRSQIHRSNLPVYGPIQPFTLTNQLGRPVSSGDLAGNVWVADIIFTRCGGPCPKMTEEMSKLQRAFAPAEPLRFVTLTTDPEFDTAPIMKSYSERFQADANRWFFLTGSKAAIKDVAASSLKLGTQEKEQADRETENDLFIHSTLFVLIDKAGKMRGIYESLEPGFQEKVQADIQGLLQED